MSPLTHFPPTSHALSQDPWKKPWAKGLIIGAFLGVLYLIGTLFLYKNAVIMDGRVNTALTTCTQGVFIYAGGHSLTFLMKVITFLGGTLFLSLLTGMVCVWFYLKETPSLALFFALQMIVGATFNYILKHILSRPRPNSSCIGHWASSASFPSGHAMMSTIFLGTLVFLFTRMPSYHPWRSLLTTGAVAVAFVIGISRLYLGVHWFSDVIGGWLFGLLWTIMGLNLLTYWEHRSYAHHP